MVSVLAHEVIETATDPLLSSWFDDNGNENGDKCAWSFGTTQLTPANAAYNVVFGPRKYLIQQSWVNNPLVTGGGYCTLAYSGQGAPSAAPTPARSPAPQPSFVPVAPPNDLFAKYVVGACERERTVSVLESLAPAA